MDGRPPSRLRPFSSFLAGGPSQPRRQADPPHIDSHLGVHNAAGTA